MANLLTNSAVIAADSNAGSSFLPTAAIDKNVGSLWSSAGTAYPHWIGYDFLAAATFATAIGSGTASASSSYSGFPASYAFDANTATSWSSNTSGIPAWLKYDFGTTKIIKTYSITARPDVDGTVAPNTFKLQGSTDNSAWVDLDTQTSQVFLPGERKVYLVTNTTAYQYYRLYITVTNGAGLVQIAEFVMSTVDISSIYAPAINNYTITARNDSLYLRTINTWKLQGSNDNAAWTDLDTQTGIVFAQGEKKIFTCSNSTTYRWYRLYITANSNSDTNAQIAELEMSVDIPVSGIDSYTKLMLHMDGVNGSSTITDSSGTPKTVTAHGSAVLDATNPFWGLSSYHLTTSGDYVQAPVSADFSLPGDFTIDLRLAVHVVDGNYKGIFQTENPSNGDFQLLINSSNQLYLYSNAYGGTVLSASLSWTVDQWYHIALVRLGTGSNNIMLFRDGILVATGTSNVTFGTSSYEMNFGNRSIGGDVYFNGWFDEIRWSKGIARWSGTDIGTSYFTPPTGEYTGAADATVTPDVLGITASVQTPTELLQWDSTFAATVLNSSIDLITPANIGAITTILPTVFGITSSILAPSFSASSKVLPTVLGAVAQVLTPMYPGLSTLKNVKKIISFNPLVIVTDTNPLQIARVDVTDPTNPIFELFQIDGLTGASDVVYDSVFAKIYIAGKGGKIAEINAADFSTYTIYSTGITRDFLLMDFLPNFRQIYAATGYSTGEIVTMDESTSESMAMDIRFVAQAFEWLNVHINTLNAAKVNLDCRWNAELNEAISCDIRFNNVAPTSLVTPIGRGDWHVFINNVDVSVDAIDDIKMDAISIYHTDYEKSRATLTLARRHDDLNTTLSGLTSEITNQNALRIEIAGHVEFDGFIWQIDAKSETESVTIVAYTPLTKENERSLVTLSLPSIDEQINVHHAILNSPSIDNSHILADDQNPPYYTGIMIDAGFDEKQNISRWSSFQNSANVADEVSTGAFVPMQNWTYYWFATAQNFITGSEWATLNYIGTSPTGLTGDTWSITGMAFKYQRKFPDFKKRLGDGVVYEADFNSVSLAPASAIYAALQSAGYITGTGAITSHFKDAVVGYDANFNPVVFDLRLHIPGTNITSKTLNSNVLGIVDGKLGITRGVAPFRKVSSKSGRFVSVDQWVDKPAGLYVKRDEAYDYTSYVQRVADLEYKKLENINGSVIPRTKADIEIFLDGYYYYNIQMLKRINIDNTTKAGTYLNQNGFPLEVQSIEISSATMKVTLTCSNQWSKTELLEIEATYPNPDDTAYVHKATENLQFSKFDPRTMGEVQ